MVATNLPLLDICFVLLLIVGFITLTFISTVLVHFIFTFVYFSKFLSK